MLGTALGSTYELVLHDLSQEDGTITAIAGEVTGRHVGGSMSEIGLSLIAGSGPKDRAHNYVTTTPTGKIVRSSTLVLRDERDRPFGAFCINIDVTSLRQTANALLDMCGGEATPDSTTLFSDSLEQVIADVIGKVLAATSGGKPAENKERRREIIRELDEAGAFALQRAAPVVAARLGVSRATVYSDLAALRSPEEADL